MKSIKPGRGPSGMNFIGSIVAIIFGLFWTIMAVNITANSPFGMVGAIFPLFGVIFIIVGIIQAVYNYKNATGKDRYSLYDITHSGEEGDPSDNWVREETNGNEFESKKENPKNSGVQSNYCPYCGTQLERDYNFCPNCGKTI